MLDTEVHSPIGTACVWGTQNAAPGNIYTTKSTCVCVVVVCGGRWVEELTPAFYVWRGWNKYTVGLVQIRDGVVPLPVLHLTDWEVHHTCTSKV